LQIVKLVLRSSQISLVQQSNTGVLMKVWYGRHKPGITREPWTKLRVEL